MLAILSIVISVLALLATFYGLHLQRAHNVKSVKPFAKIDLIDHKKRLAIHVRNNGLGPLIIHRLTFTKGGDEYSSIQDCLDLDPKSYMHVGVIDSVERVVRPDSHLIVFEKNVERLTEAEIDHIRKQLSPITLQVAGRDIYDNKMSVERDFQWFTRHSLENET